MSLADFDTLLKIRFTEVGEQTFFSNFRLQITLHYQSAHLQFKIFLCILSNFLTIMFHLKNDVKTEDISNKVKQTWQ